MNRLYRMIAASAVALALAMTPAIGLPAEGDAEEEGFSAYSVARLKVFEGTAWVRLPDSGEWEEFTTNTPIPERARVNVPEGSEAELQFHGGQFVLLKGGSEVDVRKFDTDGSTFRLRSGEIRFDLPADDFSPVRVTVPGGGKVSFPVPGRYWLDVPDAGDARLVVRSGEGLVSVASGEFPVKIGEEASIGQDVRVTLYGDKGDDSYRPAPAMTDEERNAGVPPAAAQELRDYGEWVNSSEYGQVWRPRVASGWSPYTYGRWVWVSPYGWTWVAYEPWGWYPYHYGWWVSDPFFGWCWTPFRSFVSFSFVFGHSHFTHFHRSAFFFPSTVRFVRDGRTVRWVPLRPGERFVRSGITRSDARLARFDRPLDRGRVMVRSDRGGGTEWREWSTTQRDRRNVVVRERGSGRGGGEVRREARPPRQESPAVRQQPDRDRSGGREGVRERDVGSGGRDRVRERDGGRDESPRRDIRGRGGGRSGSVAPGVEPRRQEAGPAVRQDRVRQPRVQGDQRFRPDGTPAPRRMERSGREVVQPRAAEPTRFRGGDPGIESGFRGNDVRSGQGGSGGAPSRGSGFLRSVGSGSRGDAGGRGEVRVPAGRSQGLDMGGERRGGGGRR